MARRKKMSEEQQSVTIDEEDADEDEISCKLSINVEGKMD